MSSCPSIPPIGLSLVLLLLGLFLEPRLAFWVSCQRARDVTFQLRRGS